MNHIEDPDRLICCGIDWTPVWHDEVYADRGHLYRERARLPGFQQGCGVRRQLDGVQVHREHARHEVSAAQRFVWRGTDGVRTTNRLDE